MKQCGTNDDMSLRLRASLGTDSFCERERRIGPGQAGYTESCLAPRFGTNQDD